MKMKLIIIAFILILADDFLFAQVPGGLFPMAYYPFDSNTNDASGNGYDGAAIGSPTYTTNRFGESGKAILLDGWDYIELPNGMINTRHTVTISIWFKTYDVFGGLFGYQNAPVGTLSDPTQFVPAMFVDYAGYLNGKFWDTYTNTYYSSDLLNDDQWHNAVLVADSTYQTMYFDGVPAFSYLSDIVELPGCEYNQIGAVWGDDSWWNAVQNSWGYFNGSLDDVLIFDRALNPGEVFSIYQQNLTTSKPNETNSPEIVVYPNPATDFITISGLFPDQTKLKLVSSAGETIFSSDSPVEKEVIDLSDLSAGVYFIYYSNDGNNTSGCQKIVIYSKD